MKKKFLVITNNDNVWLKPSWARVIKKLEEEFEFFIITVPEKKIKNKHAVFYYLFSFGFFNFLLLTLFSVLRILKYFRVNIKTINAGNSINLEHFDPRRIQQYINSYGPDYIFITCSYIIPKTLLSTFNKTPWFNKHASLLPKAKGVFPYIFNYLNNDKQGISFHFVTDDVDSGDIIFSKEIEVGKSMVMFYKEVYNNFDRYFIEFFKNYELGIKHSQISKGTYFTYPDKKTINNFQKLGGKVIVLEDLLNV